MKQFFLLIALLPVFAHAQIGEPRHNFAVGANIGWNLSRVSFSPTIKQAYHHAPAVGVTARYISEKYFSAICGLQAELNYAALGWKEDIQDGSNNEYSRTIHYVQLPLLMQLGWGREQRGLKFIFEAGPQIGYAFATSDKRGGDAWDISNRPNGVVYQYDNDIDHKLDYGITGGIGVELSTPAGHFQLHGRYYYGLADIYGSSKKDFFARSANQAINIKLTYLFDIKKH